MTTTLRRLEHAAGALATRSVARMDERLPWFRAMPADQRSWVTLVAQAGVSAMVEWLRDPDQPPRLTGEVFGAAPRELIRVVSLKQTVDLIRVVVGEVEAHVDSLAEPGTETRLREGFLRYSREIAFAAARVYASYAESRGAWDARLEALVLDGLLRGAADDGGLASQAAALGWSGAGQVVVVLGGAPDADRETVRGAVVRAGRRRGLDVLAGVHGGNLVVVLAGEEDPGREIEALSSQFAAGPVVYGPTVDSLAQAHSSARAALSGRAVAAAWPQAPRPVAAADLLPERALAGDPIARAELARVAESLTAAGGPVADTVSAYLHNGASLEATARSMFVHPNTVRYRLRRAAQECGFAPTEPRGAWTLRIALALRALDGAGLDGAAISPEAATPRTSE